MAFAPHLVLLKTFNDPWEAYFLQARLEAEGVPAFVFDDHYVYVNWLIATALGGVRVMVPAHLTNEARAVWQGVVDGTYRAQLAGLFGDLDDPRCPVCGATDIARRVGLGEILLGLVVLTVTRVPLKLTPTRCTCQACGARWQEA